MNEDYFAEKWSGICYFDRNNIGNKTRSCLSGLFCGLGVVVAKLRIKNLVKQQSLLCEEMFAAVRRDHRFYSSLKTTIPQLIDSVDRICDQESCAPHDLPKPSRDVYAWLTFLSDAENLDHHEQTLKRLYRFTKSTLRRSPKHGNTAIASLELVNCSALYRARILPSGACLLYTSPSPRD